MQWTVLLAGVLTSGYFRRRISRIFGAPQEGLSCLIRMISFSICIGSWLAYRLGLRARSVNPCKPI